MFDSHRFPSVSPRSLAHHEHANETTFRPEMPTSRLREPPVASSTPGCVHHTDSTPRSGYTIESRNEDPCPSSGSSINNPRAPSTCPAINRRAQPLLRQHQPLRGLHTGRSNSPPSTCVPRTQISTHRARTELPRVRHPRIDTSVDGMVATPEIEPVWKVPPFVGLKMPRRGEVPPVEAPHACVTVFPSPAFPALRDSLFERPCAANVTTSRPEIEPARKTRLLSNSLNSRVSAAQMYAHGSAATSAHERRKNPADA